MKLLLFTLLIPSYVFSFTSSRYIYNPKDRLDIEMLLASEQTKDSETKEVNGLYTKMDASFLYKLSPKYDFRYYLSSVHLQQEDQDSEFNLDLTEVMLRDKKFLKSYFPNSNMQLELKSYYLVDAKKRERYGFTGSFIPQLIVNHRTSKKSSIEFRARRHFYYHNNKTQTLRFEDRLYFTPYYFLNRKNFLGLQFNYRHKIYGGDYFSYRTFSVQKKNNEIFKIHPSYMHLLNKQTLIELYAETYLSNTADDRPMDEIAEDEFVLGFSAFINFI